MTADDAFGSLLRAMLGPPDPQPGPPYTHVHEFPQEPSEGDAVDVEDWEPPPPAYTYTVERGRQYENGPLEVPAPFRRLRAEDALPLITGDPGRYWPT